MFGGLQLLVQLVVLMQHESIIALYVKNTTFYLRVSWYQQPNMKHMAESQWMGSVNVIFDLSRKMIFLHIKPLEFIFFTWCIERHIPWSDISWSCLSWRMSFEWIFLDNSSACLENVDFAENPAFCKNIASTNWNMKYS